MGGEEEAQPIGMLEYVTWVAIKMHNDVRKKDGANQEATVDRLSVGIPLLLENRCVFSQHAICSLLCSEYDEFRDRS